MAPEILLLNLDEIRALLNSFQGGGTVSGVSFLMAEDAIFFFDIPEVIVTGRSDGGFGEGTYNGAVLKSGIIGALNKWNEQQATSRYAVAEAKCSACQEIAAFEQFLLLTYLYLLQEENCLRHVGGQEQGNI